MISSERLNGRAAVRGLLACAFCVSLSACFDTSARPADPAFSVARDGGYDAAPDDDSGAQISVCEACLRGANDDACRTQYELCRETPRCGAIYDCAGQRGCLGRPLDQLLSCAIPCASTAGVTAADDPAVSVGFPFLTCVTGSCQAACEESAM